jgi:DNA-binding XRE family transcriptional regulator
VSERQGGVEARCALGAELAAYRRAAGYTQAEFAELIGYSRSTIANVETGRQRVPRLFWQSADTTLRAGGALLGGHDQVEAMARRELRAAARQVSRARRAAARSQPPQGSVGVPVTLADGGSGQSRSASTVFWPPGAELPQSPGTGRAVATRGLRPVTAGDLSRLRGMRQHLKDIDNGHGGGAALPLAGWYLRHEIIPLLNGRGGEPAARSLIDVVAEVQQDVGWMAYDAQKQDLAAWHFKRALRLAHAAGNRLLSGRILAAMSHQAIHLGRLRQAIDFAQAARSLTRNVATPRTVAMLAAMEACAHAAAGDARQAEQALGEAERAVSLANDGRLEPEWLDFDEGGYWGHAARAYRDLGQLRKAEQCAALSIGLCLAGHSRTHAQRHAIQATAHLRMGDIDAAAATGEEVVRQAWNLTSGHVFADVANLVAAIEPFGTPVARDFLDHARELLEARGSAPGGSAAAG